MKKRYIYILLVSILFIVSLIVIGNDTKTFKINGIKYAVSVNGSKQTSFPGKGAYDVIVNCLNATGKWNYDEWIAEVYNINGNVSCNISFNSIPLKYLNTYIKNNLTGTTQGNGQVVNENGYRYEGANPNNYIMFNNEMWRIIGVFDETSHGQTGEYLTKIIRAESIGGLAWDKSKKNDWATSSLYNLLNGAYYNATNGSSSGYCYRYSTTITGECDYTKKGIQEEYRGMVKNVTWYLGGYSDAYASANEMYAYERSTDTTYYYSGNAQTVTGYVGLMYASDFAYSPLPSDCDRDDASISYCDNSAWLKSEAYDWTITHETTAATYVFYIFMQGGIGGSSGSDDIDYFSNNGYSVRPTLYLDSSVYIVNGDGSMNNPYVIDL